MKKNILIIEDEKDIVEMLKYNLSKQGFKISAFNNGEEGFSAVKKENPDLIILDIMLPGMDGLDVCKFIKNNKETKHIPIIMLTAKSQEFDKVIGLELGADDYITKPFSIRELLARIKAVLRRTSEDKNFNNEKEILNIGDLKIDIAKVEVRVKGKKIKLTSKEFELLKILINSKSRVLSREYLLDNIWGFDNASNIETRTIDVHIRTLRRKLKTESKYIVTVKNYGYKFQLSEES